MIGSKTLNQQEIKVSRQKIEKIESDLGSNDSSNKFQWILGRLNLL